MLPSKVCKCSIGLCQSVQVLLLLYHCALESEQQRQKNKKTKAGSEPQVILLYLIVVCVHELGCQSVVHAMSLPVTGGVDQPLDRQKLLPLHRQWVGNLK